MFLRRPNGRVRLYLREPTTRSFPAARAMSSPEPPHRGPPSTLGLGLRRHAAGDPAAAGDIITHCGERLKALARRVFRDYPRLRNQTQTTEVYDEFVAALIVTLRKKTFDTTPDFLRYAGRMIHNQLLSLTRKKWPDPLGGPGSDGSDRAAGVPGREDDPYKIAARREVHEKVAALPPDQRELFFLIIYDGLTLEETADLLGVSLSTLKRRWREAKIALRQGLGDDPPS
ncbi:MAG: sigma-70 family RNA polymerase sigma factor [Gemmataceae bacterium]|nr:sigma-70 family RNA polymerase sigma factor [Gemmataceae bacterium]